MVKNKIANVFLNIAATTILGCSGCTFNSSLEQRIETMIHKLDKMETQLNIARLKDEIREMEVYVQLQQEGHSALAQRYEELATLSPNAAYFLRLGELYTAMVRFDDAERSIRKALGYSESSLVKKNKFTAAVYTNLAVLFHRKKDYTQCIKNSQIALHHEPSYSDAYVSIGACYHDTGQFDKAIEHLTKALQLNPHSAHAYYNLGLSYYQLGKFYEAGKSFAAALNVNRRHKPAAEWLERMRKENRLIAPFEKL